MKLSVMLNYAGDVKAMADEVSALEKAGVDCVWVAEAYSFDAISMMGYLAASTERVEIGSAIVNVYSRTATLLAMTFAGLDSVSGGRINCGLGASGPQVIEGFHGVPYDKPMQRIKETIEVCRATWRREVIDYHGKTIDIPLPEGEGTGLAKPLKLINHPVRESIPIWWASLKGLSVAATAEVADGWIPIFYSPASAGMYQPWLDEGFARPGARRTREDFEIASTCHLQVTDDPGPVLDALRPSLSLYMGGMGAKEQNFHKQVFERMGYADLADRVQELYLSGSKDEATALIPDALVDDMHIIGDAAEVRDKVAQWEETGVTTLLLSCRTAAEVHEVAEVLA